MDARMQRANLTAPTTPEQYRAALDRQERVIQGLRKRLDVAESSPPSVPEGWKLVPETPTFEMWEAGEDALFSGSMMNSGTCYVRMVAAAPDYER